MGALLRGELVDGDDGPEADELIRGVGLELEGEVVFDLLSPDFVLDKFCVLVRFKD